MELQPSPELACSLSLHGQTVELDSTQFQLLCQLLGSTPDVPGALDSVTLGQLFAAGIVGPADVHAGAGDAWTDRLDGVGLSPHLGITLDFVAHDVIIGGDIAAIGLFYEPSISAVATRLHAELRSITELGLKAAGVRGVPFPRARASRVTVDAAARVLQQFAEADPPLRWSRADGELAVELLAERIVPREVPHPDWSAQLTFHYGGRTRGIVVPVESLGALTAAIGALGRASLPTPSVLADRSVRRVLGVLENLDAFTAEPVPPLLPRCEPGDAMTITHMGHAHLIADGPGSRVLVDPWLFAWNDSYPQQPATVGQLGGIDAVCFTHHHGDHLDAATLLRLPQSAHLVVPASTGRPLEPRMLALASAFGFDHACELPHGQALELDDGMTIEAVPFYGEGADLLGFGANCYVLARAGRAVLVHADASPDSTGGSIVSDGSLQQLRDRYGAFAAVFGTWWQERTFRCRLSTYAALLPTIPPSDWLEPNEMCDCPPEFLVDLLSGAGAPLLIAYAENGAELFEPPEQRSSFVEAVSMLWPSLEEVAARLASEAHASIVTVTPYSAVHVPADGPAEVRRP